MLALRALARLIGVALMLALAVIGLAVALYCFDALVALGSGRPDRVVHLISIRDHVGGFLAALATPGATAGVALLCGFGAIVIGLVILVGTLRSARPRLAVLESDSQTGRLAARTRPLGEMATALAEPTDGLTRLRRPRLSTPGPIRRGRLTIRGERTRTSDPAAVKEGVTASVRPITEPFGLTPRVGLRPGNSGARAQ